MSKLKPDAAAPAKAQILDAAEMDTIVSNQCQDAAAPAKAQILDGHPVPYTLTVQVNGESVKAASAYLEIVDEFLRIKGMRRTRIDGAYVFYDAAIALVEK
jgi:hypothetical protein